MNDIFENHTIGMTINEDHVYPIMSGAGQEVCPQGAVGYSDVITTVSLIGGTCALRFVRVK